MYHFLLFCIWQHSWVNILELLYLQLSYTYKWSRILKSVSCHVVQRFLIY